jgi:flagellar biosynthesis protein FlhF
MIIKTFTAESAAAALKRVRAELGKDAVVLKTRELQDPSGQDKIEITACTESPLPVKESPSPKVANQPVRQTAVRPGTPVPFVNRLTTKQNVPEPVPMSDPLAQKLEQLEKQMNSLLAAGTGQQTENHRMRNILSASDIPGKTIDTMITSIPANASEDVIREKLSHEVNQIISAPLAIGAGDRVMVFGTPGSGKTSIIGKLAAQLVFQKQLKVTLLTLDTVKVGAFDEIQSYAEILESPAHSVRNKVPALDPNSVILIDTPALSLKDEQLQRIISQIDMPKPNYRITIFPATMRSADIERYALYLKALDPTHVAFTMLDLTETWGGIFTACSTLDRKLAFVCDSPGGFGSIQVPSAEKILNHLMNSEVSHG